MVQNIEELVYKLHTYNNRSFPILSVYLQIPQDKNERNKQLQLKFRDLINDTLKPEQIAQMQQDLNYIDAFLNEVSETNSYKSMIIFSGDNKLWEVINLHDNLPNLITISHSPYLKPLMYTLSKYRRYLVVLADREKARFFTMHMGQIEAQGGIENPTVPHKIKERNLPDLSKKIDRQFQIHLKHHFAFIGEQVNKFTNNKRISGVIVGGHKELMRNLKDSLPKHLQQKVVGEFISELNINMNDIFKYSKRVIEEINTQLNPRQIIIPA